jgi:hypothetical protein
MKGLDTPELKKVHSQLTTMKKPGNKHNLSGVKLLLWTMDPAVATDVVTLILMEGMRSADWQQFESYSP